jgi:hypothetical protein
MGKQGEENGMWGMGLDLAHDSAFACLLLCLRYCVMVVVQVNYQRTDIIHLGFLKRRDNFSQPIFKVQMWYIYEVRLVSDVIIPSEKLELLFFLSDSVRSSP